MSLNRLSNHITIIINNNFFYFFYFFYIFLSKILPGFQKCIPFRCSYCSFFFFFFFFFFIFFFLILFFFFFFFFFNTFSALKLDQHSSNVFLFHVAIVVFEI